MQAVTHPNGLQAYRTTCYTYSQYLNHRYFVFVTNESDVQTTELRTEYLFIQFSHKTRQTMPLYAYFTPRVDFNANLTTTNRFFTNYD